MTYKEAIEARNKYKPDLVGQKFDNKDDWEIRDVIVAAKPIVSQLYSKMWDEGISNEAALNFFQIKEDDYDVFVISHQWNWGSGHLAVSRIGEYLERKH